MFQAVIFIGIALAFALLKVYLEKRLAPLDSAGDERQLGDVAFDKGCSVYDLFKEAGARWNFSEWKIDSDFKRYVHQGEVPTYLHDYLQDQIQTSDHTYQKIIFSGGRPPYL